MTLTLPLKHRPGFGLAALGSQLKSKKALKSTYCHPGASPRGHASGINKVAEDKETPLRLRLNEESYRQATVLAAPLGNRACCISIG